MKAKKFNISDEEVFFILFIYSMLSHLAQLVALQTSEQEVAGSIPGSANILSED